MTEQTIGRIRADGGWDRRYGPRCDHGGRPCPIVRQAEPVEPEERPTPIKVAGLTLFVLAMFAAIAYPLAIAGQAVSHVR